MTAELIRLTRTRCGPGFNSVSVESLQPTTYLKDLYCARPWRKATDTERGQTTPSSANRSHLSPSRDNSVTTCRNTATALCMAEILLVPGIFKCYHWPGRRTFSEFSEGSWCRGHQRQTALVWIKPLLRAVCLIASLSFSSIKISSI